MKMIQKVFLGYVFNHHNEHMQFCREIRSVAIYSFLGGRTQIFGTKMCEYGIFVAKMGKYGIFVAQICKYGIFCREIL